MHNLPPGAKRAYEHGLKKASRQKDDNLNISYYAS